METLQSPGNDGAGKLSQELLELGPWFHNLHLPDGIQTAPNHPLGDFPAYKWRQLRKAIPRDLEGWRVLDIGCNAGFYSFELAQRGAEVVGIDVDVHYLRQAHWACEKLGLEDRVTFRQMQVYELARSADTYDLVLFMGVFYHLRYPLLALDIVADRTERMLVFQSLSMTGEEVSEEPGDLGFNSRDRFDESGWPKMAFIRNSFAGDSTNWWVPNRACIESLLRNVGFDVRDRPGEEIYVCERNAELSETSTRDPEELAAAIGSHHVAVDADVRSRLNGPKPN